MKFEDLGHGVYCLTTPIGDSRGDSNFGVVTTGEGLIVIDCDLRRLAELDKQIKKVADLPVRLVINTHEHFDHTSANTTLFERGAIIIGSEECRQNVINSAKEEKVVAPQILVDHKMELNLGGRRIWVEKIGNGHSPGNIVVYLPESEILFAGDLVFNQCHPVLISANTEGWLKALDRLKKLNAKQIVPGHGSVVIGAEILQKMQEYILTLRQKVKLAIDQEKSIEEIEQLELLEYDSFGKKNWLPTNLRKIYEEIVTSRNE